MSDRPCRSNGFAGGLDLHVVHAHGPLDSNKNYLEGYTEGDVMVHHIDADDNKLYFGITNGFPHGEILWVKLDADQVLDLASALMLAYTDMTSNADSND